MAGKIRWGILGTGSIARKFAEGLSYVADAELAAVGSRAKNTAESFGDVYNVPRRHGSYEALAEDPEVDVIYVSTPHPMHKDNSILCLRNGKAVLNEKPFTINATEASELIAVAREEKRFLMEAMWTRFLPITIKLRELLAEGVIGEIRMFYASFGFRSSWDETSRILDPQLGGGALLDVGVYPISYASMIFKRQPAQIVSLADIGETGVDEQSAYLFRYQEGQIAMMSSAVRTTTQHEARVIGTEGTILVHEDFWRGEKLSILRPGKRPEIIEAPLTGNGYNYEAEEVCRCLREGKLESGVMPLNESLDIMKTLDKLRAQWGMKYPMED